MTVSFQMYACLMLFFVSNAIEGQLISTGAFEISFNGEQSELPLQLGWACAFFTALFSQ